MSNRARWLNLLSTSEDVDEALYTFETYFDGITAPKEMWPKMVLMLLGGQAKKAWLASASRQE